MNPRFYPIEEPTPRAGAIDDGIPSDITDALQHLLTAVDNHYHTVEKCRRRGVLIDAIARALRGEAAGTIYTWNEARKTDDEPLWHERPTP